MIILSQMIGQETTKLLDYLPTNRYDWQWRTCSDDLYRTCSKTKSLNNVYQSFDASLCIPSKHVRTGPVRAGYGHGRDSPNTAHNRLDGHPKGPRMLPVWAAHRQTCRACTGTSPVPLFARTCPLPRPVQFCPYRPRTGLPPCLPYRHLPAGTAPVPDPDRFARIGHVPFTRTSPFPDPYRTHTLTISNPYPPGRPTGPINFSQYLPVSDTCQYHFRSVQ